MRVTSIKLSKLSKEKKEFLFSLPQSSPEEDGIPVYLIVENCAYFISDFKLSSKANKQFEKEAPAGLYRGGAVIKVQSKYGTLVVPDDRYKWWKPFAGIANFSEGLDLTKTGARELIEEAFVYSSDKKTRFVPKGMLSATKLCSLDFEAEQVKELGKIEIVGFEINETNRALEAVLHWDISKIDVPYSVSLEEEWFAGGKNGISVYAINSSGEIVGIFSGQQGFQEIANFGIHETLKHLL